MAATALVLFGAAGPAAAATTGTTAWRQGRFHVDVPGVVGRSDAVLGQPNRDPWQAMPLGNGGLGAAVWSADGLTASSTGQTLCPTGCRPASW